MLREAITNITGIAASLLGRGATRILVPGMPDLGLTPGAADPAGGSAIAAGFNASLQSTLSASLPPGSWQYFDTFRDCSTPSPPTPRRSDPQLRTQWRVTLDSSALVGVVFPSPVS